jgi:hypothetical protein
MRPIGWVLALLTAALLAAGVALNVAAPFKFGSIDATGTLSTCFTGEPVFTLDGDWQSALPADARTSSPGYVPLAIILSGWLYDQTSGELRAPNGQVKARNGDRVRIEATVVAVHGDPSPCYYTLGLKLGDVQTE